MRSTQGGQWKPKVVRYNDFKGYIVAQLIDALDAMTKQEREQYRDLIYIAKGKPIRESKEKIYVNLMITFKDKTHGDSDNIFKGIADALFMNDKYVAGSFDYKYGDSGKVDVEIIWEK